MARLCTGVGSKPALSLKLQLYKYWSCHQWSPVKSCQETRKYGRKKSSWWRHKSIGPNTHTHILTHTHTPTQTSTLKAKLRDTHIHIHTSSYCIQLYIFRVSVCCLIPTLNCFKYSKVTVAQWLTLKSHKHSPGSSLCLSMIFKAEEFVFVLEINIWTMNIFLIILQPPKIYLYWQLVQTRQFFEV